MVHSITDPVTEIPLASGETYRITQTEAIRSLTKLHQWYSDQEKEWYEKTYYGVECFSEGYEREWMRYRSEAAALQFAINILSEEKPQELAELRSVLYAARHMEDMLSEAMPKLSDALATYDTTIECSGDPGSCPNNEDTDYCCSHEEASREGLCREGFSSGVGPCILKAGHKGQHRFVPNEQYKTKV